MVGSIKDDAIGINSVSHFKISAKEFLNIENMSLRHIKVFRTMIHESYHNTATASFDASSGDKNFLIEHNGQGVSYASQKNTYGHAFEEGLAVDFELSVFDQVKKDIFSSEFLANYDKFILQHSIDAYEDLPSGAEKYLNIKEFSSDQKKGVEEIITSFNEEYFNSYKLVCFLKEEIPNFLNLVEKARIERRSLGLVRAIEERFGEGSYRKITTVNTKESSDLLKELRA